MQLTNNAQRAQGILIVFYIMLAFTPIIIWSHFLQYFLVSSYISNPADFVVSDAEYNDNRQQIIAFINISFRLLAVVFFLRWFSRAYDNLHQTNAKLEFKKYEASWSWFIPFLNLVRPYQIMKELWLKTQEQSGEIKEPETVLVTLWWTSLMVSNTLNSIGSRIYKTETFEDIQASTMISIVSEFIALPGLILIIIIIRKMTVFEADLYDQKNNTDLADHLIKVD